MSPASTFRAFWALFLQVFRLGRGHWQQGPLDDKTAHLVQLSAAAAIQSEGAVHSHIRRATGAGATPEENGEANRRRIYGVISACSTVTLFCLALRPWC